MDQSEPDFYAYLKQYEEVLIPFRKDVEDVINKILGEEDINVASPCCIDDENWINPFAITFDDEAPLGMDHVAIIDNHHMQMSHYGKGLEDFGYPIFDEISLGLVQSFLPKIEDHMRFHIETSFSGINPTTLPSLRVGHDYHSQRYLLGSIRDDE